MGESFLIGDELYSYEVLEKVADYYASQGATESLAKWGVTPYEFAVDVSESMTEAEWGAILDKAGINSFTNVGGNYANFARNVAVENAGVESSSALAVKTAVKDSKLVAEPLEEVTTQAGEKLSKGGAITGIPAVDYTIATLATVGLVYKDYKTHEDWWTDLSEKVFNQDGAYTFKPTGNLGIDPVYGSAIGEVILRRVTDQFGITSYYKSFAPEENIASAVYELSKLNAFTDELELEDVVPQTAEQDTYYMLHTGDASFNHVVEAYALMRRYSSNQTSFVISHSKLAEIFNDAVQSATGSYNAIAVNSASNASAGTTAITIRLVNLNTNPAQIRYVEEKYNTAYNKKRFRIKNTRDISLVSNYLYIFSSEDNYFRTTASETVSDISNTGFWGDSASGTGHSSSLFTNITEVGGIEQAEPDEEAVVFVPPSGDYSLEDIINALRNQYPDWYDNSFEVENYDPVTKQTKKTRYLPISFPNARPQDYDKTNPYPQDEAQDGEVPKDRDITKRLLGEYSKPVIKIITNTPTPTPTPNDTPTDPSAGLVDGGSNNLWAVYNPTKSEISGVGAYLWSSDIGDLIAKWFANPMDAIISLHLIYATPSTGGKQDIILGYLNSHVSANVVTNQYTSIDCGTVYVPEYFGDVRDYSPYTQVYLYLPFIGIKAVSTEDVIGCDVGIKYNIDVLTGAVLCNIFVTKKGATQILYTFAGNCSVQIPLTGADRTRLLSGAISAVSSAVTGAMAGNVAGAVVGGVGGVVNGLHNSSAVDRTGTFSANAGAMGVKKPYIIIQRKTSYDADNYNEFYGIPSNTTVILSQCNGYTRVKDVHVENISVATQEEKNMIELALKQGVIIK